MATMKTLKFPGSNNVYEMVDATARAGVASLQTAVIGLADDTAAANAAASSALTAASSALANIGNLNELDTTDKTSVVGAINETYGMFIQSVDDAVADWLDNHPEATTTVQDHSLTYAKLINGTLGFVTPEMYGAKGDRTTDDTTAITNACNSGLPIYGKPTNNYLIGAGATFANAEFHNVHFYFAPSSALTSGASFNNCKLYDCVFESANQYPSPWNGATGVFSNIYISGNNSGFINCKFTECEHLSLGDINGNPTVIQGCHFIDCASGITGNGVSNVYISGCYFDMLDYAGELEHSIYAANDCSDWVVDSVISKGCKYYPLHIYNSTSGENPKRITVTNSVFYDAVYGVANNGELLIDNVYFDNSSNNLTRYLFAAGKTQITNCTIDGNALLYISTGDEGILFENCNINCTKVVADFGNSNSGKIYLTIKGSTVNAAYISSFNRSINFRSENNVYQTYTQMVSNTDSSVVSELCFRGDTFEGGGDIVYASHFELLMLDSFINYASARITIASRTATGGSTAFLSNCTAKASGNYISYNSGVANLAKNNCFNINP